MSNVRSSQEDKRCEVRLAVTVRLLDGGEALDLGVIFDIYPDNCTKIMYDVLLKLIIPSDIGIINMTEYVGNDNMMDKVSIDFSQRSNSVLKGAIGVLDGWLVKIVKPSWLGDKVNNPLTFFQGKNSTH